MNTEIIRREEIATPGTKTIIMLLDNPADPASEVTHGRYELVVERFGRSDVKSWHDTREGGEAAFSDALEVYALPLQAAFFRAKLQHDKRYTIVLIGDFGFPCSIPFTFDYAKCDTYAQYNDVVRAVFTPAKKRKQRCLTLYNRDFLIYDGWRELPDELVFEVNHLGNGIVTKGSKYSSFDDRYMVDIKAAWPDYILAFDCKKAYAYNANPNEPQEEKPAPQEKPFEPREITPGLTLMEDTENGNGLCVDMSPEMFEQLYAQPTDNLTVEDKLIRALRRATVASVKHVREDDGGTCNFDSPTLDYKAAGLTKSNAERVIKSLGFSCRDWEGLLVIRGYFPGQGNRRTRMAEAFCESMRKDGYASGMYYQMD